VARVHSPREGYDGVSVGVRFRDGVAEVNPAEHPAALAYFERAGYRIEHGDPAAEVEQGQPEAPERPADRGPKAEWVRYVVALGELDEDEAEKLTRDQLVERYGAASPTD
jgi:hypothetical protein